MQGVTSSAYRSPTSPVLPDAADAEGDGDLIVPLSLLWLVSAVRIAVAVIEAERFGAEATIALFFAVVLPWLVVVRRVGGGIKNP